MRERGQRSNHFIFFHDSTILEESREGKWRALVGKL
jgi:hypothetical protein